MRVVYSDGYFADIGEHVFPMEKYRLVKEKLVTEGVISDQDLVEPEPVTEADILLVHDPVYVRNLRLDLLTPEELLVLEIPSSRAVFEAFALMAGGTVAASRTALEDGVAASIGGGFHHAFPDHGEGFCMLNDVAIAVEKLMAEKLVSRALIVDCDLHQGNGTAAVFRGRPDVYTFSIHQEHNYPFPKQKSTLDIGLADGTAGDEYNARLLKALPPMFKNFRPDLAIYLAGADPYEQDQLGALKLTKDDLRQRDRIVMSMARGFRVPVCVLLAGGYARDTADTVDIHCRTIAVAKEFSGFGSET
ncbi:MAG: histone deacetylase [Candidatus Eisenbacteria bacterium]|nr:histone deacetylase [Candidatus Eisenbacteria bacterium]